MPVDIVIVNWNGGREVLAAIESGLRFGANVVVVDNASQTGVGPSLDSVAGISLIRNRTNVGFGAASNIGAASSTSDIILLLNPDAQIITGTSAELERAFEPAGVMLVGMPLEQSAGHPLPSAYPLPRTRNLLKDLLRVESIRRRAGLQRRPPDTASRQPGAAWVVGAALAMRRVDWQRLGGMDEGFFLWYEDVDLGARVARAGGSMAIADGLLVRHTGASTWTSLPRRRRQWLRFKGARRYAANNLGPGAAAAMVAAAPFALAIGVALDVAHWITRRP